MFAIVRTFNCVLALLAATLRTDLASHAGTMTPSAPFFAELARDIHGMEDFQEGNARALRPFHSYRIIGEQGGE
jgi:hypothetical protein